MVVAGATCPEDRALQLLRRTSTIRKALPLCSLDRAMRLATWNLAWASPRSAKGARIKTKLDGVAADVWVITEGRLALVPDGGHLIDAGDDWGTATAAIAAR